MRDQEKRIREQRTIEATKKNLMGVQGKLGCIVRYLGEAIKDQGGGLVDTHAVADYWYQDYQGDNSDMPTADLEEGVYVLGWLFNGLTNGVNMEIRYIGLDHALTVHWHGRLVYREVRGELEAYAPQADWEEAVERLYQIARPRAKKEKRLEAEEESQLVEQEKVSFLKRLRDVWGI